MLPQALLTLHADYMVANMPTKGSGISPRSSIYAVGHTQNPGIQRLASVKRKGDPRTTTEKSLHTAMERWRQAMNNINQ